MLIHVIRHTTPDIATNICYGQADIQLATSFTEEAKLISDKLKRQKNQGQYEHILSSPAKRCQLLAQEIRQLQEIPLQKNDIILDDNLQEFNFGDWELISWDDIPREESQAWTDDFVHTSPPNGESLLQMQQRVKVFITNLSTYNSPIAVITHAGVMRLLLSHFLNIPLENIFNLKLNFGQIIELNIVKNNYSLRFVD